MKKTVFAIVAALTFCLNSSAWALGPIRINPESPLLTDSPMIAKIYEKSCIAGSNINTITEGFPTYEVDSISDQFKAIYPRDKMVLWINIPFFVAAGYDIGRTFSLTDMNGVDIEDTCKQYSIDFAAGIVNNKQNWNRSISPSPAPLSPAVEFETLTLFNNPFNDVFAPKQGKHLLVTPRLAKENGCRYMYIVLAKHPVIDVSPYDATYDMMENMLWDDYDHDTIRDAYTYILMGAKQGQYLFQNNQSIQVCFQ